jgi:uncharacterized protein YkwD
MIALTCAFLLAQGSAAAAIEPIRVGYVASGLNAQAALRELNAYRRSHGLRPLVLDARLSQAAAVQAQTQARRGAIGHKGPDGSRSMQRAARADYHGYLSAENVASGQKSFSQALRGWEGSPEHKRNLLLPDGGLWIAADS